MPKQVQQKQAGGKFVSTGDPVADDRNWIGRQLGTGIGGFWLVILRISNWRMQQNHIILMNKQRISNKKLKKYRLIQIKQQLIEPMGREIHQRSFKQIRIIKQGIKTLNHKIERFQKIGNIKKIGNQNQILMIPFRICSKRKNDSNIKHQFLEKISQNEFYSFLRKLCYNSLQQITTLLVYFSIIIFFKQILQIFMIILKSPSIDNQSFLFGFLIIFSCLIVLPHQSHIQANDLSILNNIINSWYHFILKPYQLSQWQITVLIEIFQNRCVKGHYNYRKHLSTCLMSVQIKRFQQFYYWFSNIDITVSNMIIKVFNFQQDAFFCIIFRIIFKHCIQYFFQGRNFQHCIKFTLSIINALTNCKFFQFFQSKIIYPPIFFNFTIQFSRCFSFIIISMFFYITNQTKI